MLERSVQQTLETMCFSEADRVMEEFPKTDSIGAAVEFQGTVKGHLRIDVQAGAAVWFTAAFLGVEERDVQLRTAEETVCELGNIICGRFLSLLHPGTTVTLGPPRRLSDIPAGCCWQHFRSRAGLLRVAIRWD